MSKYKYKNILLTGAAGALGNQLRETLSKECDTLKISDKVNLEIKYASGEIKRIETLCRIDTKNELEYYKNGGILQYVLRNMI